MVLFNLDYMSGTMPFVMVVSLSINESCPCHATHHAHVIWLISQYTTSIMRNLKSVAFYSILFPTILRMNSVVKDLGFISQGNRQYFKCIE